MTTTTEKKAYLGLLEDGLTIRNLNTMECTLLFNLSGLGIKDEPTEERLDFSDFASNDPACIIIKDRLNRAGGTAELSGLIYLSYIMGGVPGRMVTWAYTLYLIWRDKEAKDGVRAPVTLAEVVYTMPSGVPDDKAYLKAWDAQKGYTLGLEGVDNALDVIPWEKLATGDF